MSNSLFNESGNRESLKGIFLSSMLDTQSRFMQDLFAYKQNYALIHHFVFHYSILPKKSEIQHLSSKRESNRCRLDTFACQFECGAYREHRRKLDLTAGLRKSLGFSSPSVPLRRGRLNSSFEPQSRAQSSHSLLKKKSKCCLRRLRLCLEDRKQKDSYNLV